MDNLLGVLNNKAASAEMSFAPKLPDNPLNGMVKPNLNTNLSQVIAVYNGETGALDSDYAYGLERISVHDEDTTTGKVQDPLYYLYNGTGNVSELTNMAGHVSDKYRFDPFGVELPGGKMSPNAPNVLNNPFGYNGEMNDPDANLTYLRNRYYEPETGVFMTRDLLPGQLQNPLTLNTYAYVTNNPLNFIDPLGLEKTPGFCNYFFAGLETAGGVLEISAGGALSGTGVGSVVRVWMIANGTSHTVSGALDIYDYATGNYSRVGTNNVVKNTFVGALGKNGEIMYDVQDLAAGFAGGYVASSRNALTNVGSNIEGGSKAGLSNPLPANGRFAAVMPQKFANQLAKGEGYLSGNSEAWITTADDLKGINTVEGAAQRLTLVDETGALRLHGDAVVEFDLKNPTGLASPYNRLNPGFVNGGRTGGGAREWLIPSNAEIDNIVIRSLER